MSEHNKKILYPVGSGDVREGIPEFVAKYYPEATEEEKKLLIEALQKFGADQ